MRQDRPHPITLQITVDFHLQYELKRAALDLGISNEEYRRQALAFAVRSDRFKKHMEKVYAKTS